MVVELILCIELFYSIVVLRIYADDAASVHHEHKNIILYSLHYSAVLPPFSANVVNQSLLGPVGP